MKYIDSRIRKIRAGVSSRAVFIANVVSKIDTSSLHLVICDNKKDALFFVSDMYNFFDDESVYIFPTTSIQSKHSIKEATSKVQRTAVISAIDRFSGTNISDEVIDELSKISDITISKDLLDRSYNSRNNPIIIVAYTESLEEKVLSRNCTKKSIISLECGMKVSHEFIRDVLFENSFKRVDFVDEPGQFAVRGSIIDIFSYSDNQPYRVDFFGDEIEAITRFNLNTQRSENNVSKVDIYPNLFENFTESNYIEFIEYLPAQTKIWDIRSVIDEGRVEVEVEPQPAFNKNFEILYKDIYDKQSEGYSVNILSPNLNQTVRLQQILQDIGGEVVVHFIPLSIHEGFINHKTKECYYTDHQIFERYHKVKVTKEITKSEQLTINDLMAFHIGDYIVHIDYGVGQFGGLVRSDINGKRQELIKILYKDGDIVFLSIHGIHKISRYKSKDSEPPKIYRLGSKNWENLKKSTKSKVKDIANELIKLYSERMQTNGFAFSADSYLQQELESSFMYEDTPDQHKATIAIKEDMESIHPMDRLICGDVGFGKTELAIRAAFKAVCDSKQVAVLVPTTILALQHYHTFKARLKNFPCNIEYISRLKTAKEVREISENLQKGKIDILIGTHKILNKSIKFKDLGLLIIDEEQKFGVSAKEKLRQLKMNIDTLTLSATPIPRTLQFSLLGARDLSIISTPPPNRIPVYTEIIEFNEELLKSIISTELERGGQIFFIHNRIEDIESINDKIKSLYPGIRTCVAHGKMDPTELESKIIDFIDGDYDILISTTIIENGIDIPNANTIIINQAQNIGLSGLHQLRGRVGRSNIKSYCYLIVPPMVSMTDEAKRRLNAIETFSDLGSGFNIAMQDLDIRGAGNLLGAEQSGFIADMGFETYQKILNEALAEMRNDISNLIEEGDEEGSIVVVKEGEWISDCFIDTDIEAYIPDSYININSEKLRLYKNLDSMKSEDEIKYFIEEMEDRFGKIPLQLNELINIVRLRIIAIRLGIEKIIIKGGRMCLYLVLNQNSPYYSSDTFNNLLNHILKTKNRFKFISNKQYIEVQNINTIENAVDILKEMLPL